MANIDKWLDDLEAELRRRTNPIEPQAFDERIDEIVAGYWNRIDRLRETVKGKTISDLDWEESHALHDLDGSGLWFAFLCRTAAEKGEEIIRKDVAQPVRNNLIWLSDQELETRAAVLELEFGMVGDLRQEIDGHDWGWWGCYGDNPAYVELMREKHGLKPCPGGGPRAPHIGCKVCSDGESLGRGWIPIDE